MIGPRGAATASDGIPLGLNGTLARCVPALLISLLISLFVTLGPGRADLHDAGL